MKRRRLGQHYLIDQEAVRRVVELAQIQPSERVLEIGTGKGILTRELARKGVSLVAYEVDRQNFAETLEALKETGAEVRLADAFKQKPEFDVLASSLPYSQSAIFVEWLSGMRFGRAVVVLQEDFVRKIMAHPGERDYRGISALAQIAFEVKVLGRIDRKSFSPPPRVNSVIVSFTPRHRVSRTEIANIMRLFTLRRRQVVSVLAELGIERKTEYGLRRVYGLRPDEVYELCRPTGSK
jgi:16S rRNA (adenine1518-N6/adenine1519-N6)-dimethyltransferase